MKFVLVLFGIFSFLFSASAFSQEWQHINLRGNHGIAVNIDYKVQYESLGVPRPQHVKKVCPIYVNVRFDGIRPDSQVRAIVRNIRQKEGSDYIVKDQYLFNLLFQGDHYSLGLEKAYKFYYFDWVEELEEDHCLEVESDGYNGKWISHQTVSIQIDGEWVIDPVSKTQNFIFTF
jgi:hypothetical protein